MSILIKGMEMPKNCGFCPFCRKTITEWGSIYSADCIIRKMPIKFSELDLRDGLCPLIELPPHGRLIDADALMLIIQDYIEEYSWYTDEHGFHSDKWCAMKETEMAINAAPTIVEADNNTQNMRDESEGEDEKEM